MFGCSSEKFKNTIVFLALACFGVIMMMMGSSPPSSGSSSYGSMKSTTSIVTDNGLNDLHFHDNSNDHLVHGSMKSTTSIVTDNGPYDLHPHDDNNHHLAHVSLKSKSKSLCTGTVNENKHVVLSAASDDATGKSSEEEEEKDGDAICHEDTYQKTCEGRVKVTSAVPDEKLKENCFLIEIRIIWLQKYKVCSNCPDGTTFSKDTDRSCPLQCDQTSLCTSISPPGTSMTLHITPGIIRCILKENGKTTFDCLQGYLWNGRFRPSA